MARIVYDLNVFTFNTTEACAQVAEIARVHAADGPDAPGVLLELGNELMDSGQGLPRFPNSTTYIDAMAPIVACARELLGAKAQVALVGALGAWSEGLGKSPLLSQFDAVTYHEYVPCSVEMRCSLGVCPA